MMKLEGMFKNYIYVVTIFSLLIPQGILLSQIGYNQLYFTNNADINPLNLSHTDVQSEFNINDNIYAFMITERSMEDILPNSQRFYYVKTKDLPILSHERFKTPSQWVNPIASYYVFPVILHVRPETNFNTSAFRVMQHLSELSNGTHQVTIQIKEEGTVKYASSFKLKVNAPPNDITKTSEINPNARKKGYLQFGMKQSDIEKAILKLLNDTYPSQGFKRTIITSEHYINKRKSSGRIAYRTLNVDVISKRSGECRAYDVTVMQKKVGTDFGVYEIDKINGYYPVSCVDAR